MINYPSIKNFRNTKKSIIKKPKKSPHYKICFEKAMKLTTLEKLYLIQFLWISIINSYSTFPLPKHLKKSLLKRYHRRIKNTNRKSSWTTKKERTRIKYKNDVKRIEIYLYSEMMIDIPFPFTKDPEKILDDRYQEYIKNPNNNLTWQEVKDRIMNKNTKKIEEELIKKKAFETLRIAVITTWSKGLEIDENVHPAFTEYKTSIGQGTTKDPEQDAKLLDIIYQDYVQEKILRGIQEAKDGNYLSHAKAKKMFFMDK